MFKKIITITLLIPFTAFSNEHMADAQKFIATSQKKAEIAGTYLAEQDFITVYSKVLEKINGKGEHIEKIKSNLITRNKDLLEAFKKQSSENSSTIAKTYDAVKATYDKYLELSRERFALSFASAEISQNKTDLVVTLNNIEEEYSNLCKIGKSDYSIDFDRLPVVKLPEPQFNIGFVYGLRNANNSFTFNMSSPAHIGQDMQDTNQNVQASTMIAYAGSSVSTLAAAAAPYLLGASVAIAAYTYFASAEEMASLQNEITEAEKYKFANMARSPKVEESYRKRCSGLVQDIHDISKISNLLLGNSPEKIDLLEQVTSSQAERKIWKEEALKGRKLVDQKTLLLAIKNKNCEPVSPEKLADSKSLCVDGGTSYFLKEDPSIRREASDDELRNIDQTIQRIEIKLKEIENKYSEVQQKKFKLYHMIDALNGVLSTDAQILSRKAWIQLDQEQAIAFQKLLEILDLFRLQNKNLITKSLALEIEASQQFFELSGEFEELIAATIQSLFGMANSSDVQIKAITYANHLKPFVEQYLYIKEVENLNDGFIAWKHIYEN